jgi:hypothetical protein
MNERIREFAEQAGINKDAFQFSGTPIKHIVDGPSLEKFAELIVEDVLEILADRKNYNKHLYTTWDLSRADGIVYELAESIQKRFGTTKNFKVIEHGTVGGKVSSE